MLSTVSVALLLCSLLFCLWKKNQRLEYKYMSLVAKASSKVKNYCTTLLFLHEELDIYLIIMKDNIRNIEIQVQYCNLWQDGMMELPRPESCALDDGEEEEVQFTKNPPRGILSKFRQHKIAVSVFLLTTVLI